jgi:hypothetical protein
LWFQGLFPILLPLLRIMSPYSPTLRLYLAMSSTVGGQRQILKRPIPVVQYIRKAVESGVYRTGEEMLRIRKERREGLEDIRVIMNRFRQDVIRGSHIQDYPTEYFILEQHPPIPDPPRTPKRIWNRTVQPKPNPVDKLTRKYMTHLEKTDPHAATSASSSKRRTPPPETFGGPASSEEYYRRLLGVQAAGALRNASSSNTSGILNLQQKPALVQKAYAAAVLHHHLQRQNTDQSDEEVMAQVDAMLAQQTAHEQRVSAERRQNIVNHSQGIRGPTKTDAAAPTKPSPDAFPFSVLGLDAPAEGASSSAKKDSAETAAAASDAANEHSYDSIFSSDPLTIQGMMRWSDRLQAVPYKEWTVGASTALDHWIARQVLQLSEETWQSLLEGTDPALLSMGRDIIACRETVFPETALHPTRVQQEMRLARVNDVFVAPVDRSSEATDQSSALETPMVEEDKEARTIEDLLQRLGGLRAPDAPSRPAARAETQVADEWSSMMEASNLNNLDVDAQIDQLVRELQNWRRRNMETPYDSWDPEDQHRFDSWMKTFVYTVSSEAERRRIRRSSNAVDYEETRLALLADRPVSPEESDAFWSQLRDESTVEALLDHMVEDGPPPGASILQASFWDLPREVQLERLVNLGAVRPLLDEYTKETDRLRFLQRYGDIILTGVPLEHLVADPSGPIRAADLSREIVATLRISEYERFRMERLPYKAFAEQDATEETKAQQDAFEKSRLLFKAWNEHKAGRARYEEKLFQTGRLGLRYSDSMSDEKRKSKKQDDSSFKGKTK